MGLEGCGLYLGIRYRRRLRSSSTWGTTSVPSSSYGKKMLLWRAGDLLDGGYYARCIEFQADAIGIAYLEE